MMRVVAGGGIGIPQSPPLHRPRLEVGDHDVGVLHETQEDITALGNAQVDRHAPFAPVVGGEERRASISAADGQPPGLVTEARELDLDDVRSPLLHRQRCLRTLDEEPGLQDTDALERSHRHLAREALFAGGHSPHLCELQPVGQTQTVLPTRRVAPHEGPDSPRGSAQALGPGARCGRLTSAPPDAPEHVRVTPARAASLEGAIGLWHAATPDCLSAAGGAPLHAAPRMVHPSQGRSAVSAVLRLVAVPRPELLAPRDGDVGPALDDDGVRQAADPLGHLASTVRTNGHDSPLFNRVADHLRHV